MAMRGLRPIAEIQYLDYIYYALQLMRDDLASVHYRSAGGQKAPLIISTRGHRLEGVWHAGSPMAAIINNGSYYKQCSWNACVCTSQHDTSGWYV